MGKTPVRSAASWTHWTNLSGPICPRMFAEYSTMMCGMSSSSVRLFQRALDFPRRRLGHPNQGSLPPAIEAQRNRRDAHRGDGMPSRVFDRHADARDFFDDVALGKRVLSHAGLLDLAPDARRAHCLEADKPLGVHLENLLNLLIRQRSEQREAARPDAERSTSTDFH